VTSRPPGETSPQGGGEPLLTTRGLTRRFGGLTAVDDVDFALDRGGVQAVIGPNGAGKTTFVSLLSGRLAPSEGMVAFEGRDVTRLPAWRRVRLGIAYTFQITSIYPALTARENAAVAASGAVLRRGGSEREARAATDRALERVGLSHLAETRAGALAYGHQRLVEVAMGLALAPRLLILDEPTQGLSDPEIEAFLTLVREIGSEATVLLIEHNMPVVMALAHRITVMDRGRLLAEGPPEAIRADPAVQAAYLGAPA
jgi:branched-chain amino acid transport system ATP-binding protein